MPCPLFVAVHWQAVEANNQEHFREWSLSHLWSRNEEDGFNPSPDVVAALAKQFMDANYHIHFHTWTPVAFVEFLRRAASELQFPMVVDEMVVDGLDLLAVISKV